MNNFLECLKEEQNYGLTENGAVKHNTTMSALLDLFAMGASMRNRSDDDCILLFKQAYDENPEYAMKCLFYIRDIRGGQGERRFFRLCYQWLAKVHTEAAKRNLEYLAEYGRWDDFYCLVGTPLETRAFSFLKEQFDLDLTCETPSLLGKWLKSCNCSSSKSRQLGLLTRKYFGLSERQYRKALSTLRAKLNIVERLMSENRWDEIKFDHIPSKAGLIYKNAFARRDIIKEKYKAFAEDNNTTVNAGTLYPYEVVEKALDYSLNNSTKRAMVNKYWENLTDYFNGQSLNALCVCDTSGSMFGTPIQVAISLSLYCAERAKGPFANHYISFSRQARLIECKGVDFVDKVRRIEGADLCENTNIESVFDLLLDTAKKNHLVQKDLPENILIISDMEFDQAQGYGYFYTQSYASHETLMEGIARKWEANGYQMPHLIFWNVNARTQNIPMLDHGPISFISGFSPFIFQTILSGKTGSELMMEALNSERYSKIH